MQAEADDNGASISGRVEKVPQASLVTKVADHCLLHLFQFLLQLVLRNVALQFLQAVDRLLVAISHEQEVRRLGHPREGQEEDQRNDQTDVSETFVGNERANCVSVQFSKRNHQLDEGAEGASDFLIGDFADVHRADDVHDALTDAADEARRVEDIRIPRNDDQQPANGQWYPGYQKARFPTQPIDYESRQDAAGYGAQKIERGDPGSIVRSYRDMRLG